MTQNTYYKQNWITIYDVFLLQPFAQEIPRKTAIKIKKQLKWHKSKLREEVRVCVYVFLAFFKMMIKDILVNHVMFRYSKLKNIRLKRVTHPATIKAMCKHNMLIPSMPIHSVMLQSKNEYFFKTKFMILKNELNDILTEQNQNGYATEGVKAVHNVFTYIKPIKELFPDLSEQLIRKIISFGLKYLFLPLDNKHIQLRITEYKKTPLDLQRITNTEVYSYNYNKIQLVRSLYSEENKKCYAILTDEQKESLSKEETIDQTCCRGIDGVKLVQRKTRLMYKHVYEIVDANPKDYKLRRIQNVKTSDLKYVYRRVNNRLKPINNSE